MKKKKKKRYRVNVDMECSHDFIVSAGTKAEAQKLAVEKLKKKLNKKMFNFFTDLED